MSKGKFTGWYDGNGDALHEGDWIYGLHPADDEGFVEEYDGRWVIHWFWERKRKRERMCNIEGFYKK